VVVPVPAVPPLVLLPLVGEVLPLVPAVELPLPEPVLVPAAPPASGDFVEEQAAKRPKVTREEKKRCERPLSI
jgi:hypothetical protein